jgi:hypothetical protein
MMQIPMIKKLLIIFPSERFYENQKAAQRNFIGFHWLTHNFKEYTGK